MANRLGGKAGGTKGENEGELRHELKKAASEGGLWGQDQTGSGTTPISGAPTVWQGIFVAKSR